MSYSTACSRIDDTFGPHAKECRDEFDFTLLFEESILSIVPLALLLLLAPNRIIYLFQKKTKVIHSPIIFAKLVRLYPLTPFEYSVMPLDFWKQSH